MILQAHNLVCGYPHGFQSSPLSFLIGKNQILGIHGSNGSGKSTLVKTILGLIPPSSGTFNSQKGMTIGYVPQTQNVNNIIPITVSEVLGKTPSISLDQIGDPLSVMSRLQDSFHALSGGWKQRVLISRALIHKPELLILDEPFNHLDTASEALLKKWLGEFVSQNNHAIMIIDHMFSRLGDLTNNILEMPAPNKVAP